MSRGGGKGPRGYMLGVSVGGGGGLYPKRYKTSFSKY